MTNGKVTDAEVDVIVSGGPEELNRFLVRSCLVHSKKLETIAQHCRYCDDNGADKGADSEPEDDRRVWVMWGTGTVLVRNVLLPVLVCGLSTILTLAITGQLGG